MTKPFIVTLTGPSCAGKTTLEGRLGALGFAHIISTTTRPVRMGESDGVNYYFVDSGEFDRMEAMGEFVESVKFGLHKYGASVKEIERIAATGKPIVVVVEPNGRAQIAKYANEHGWELLQVYIDNPPDVLARRFLKRFADQMFQNESTTVHSMIIQQQGSRLADMMTVERSWAVEAYDSLGPYDHIARDFGDHNMEKIAQAILHRAVDRMNR